MLVLILNPRLDFGRRVGDLERNAGPSSFSWTLQDLHRLCDYYCGVHVSGLHLIRSLAMFVNCCLTSEFSSYIIIIPDKLG